MPSVVTEQDIDDAYYVYQDEFRKALRKSGGAFPLPPVPRLCPESRMTLRAILENYEASRCK